MRRASGAVPNPVTVTSRRRSNVGSRTSNTGQQRIDMEKERQQAISDEADSTKKMRRMTHYRECARQFIRYFTDAGRQ